jgi:hypothetical protein
MREELSPHEIESAFEILLVFAVLAIQSCPKLR